VQALSAVDLSKKFEFRDGQDKDEGFGRVNDIFGNDEIVIIAHDEGTLNIYRKNPCALHTKW